MREELANATFLSEEWQEGDRRDMTAEEWTVRYIKNAPHLEKEIRQICTHLRDIFSVYPYTRSWIRTMKKMGYRVYYLSNYPERIYQDCREALDFTDHCNGGILSFQEKVVKPDREMYELLLTRYSLVPEECVFMDDLEPNVKAARECGFNAFVFTTKDEAEEELRKLGVCI